MRPDVNCVATILCAVLLGSATLVAQSQRSSESGFEAVRAPGALDCPVSMRAEHGSGGGLIMTRQPKSNSDPQPAEPKSPSQQLHLILSKSVARARITGARVTVRGTNGKGRAVPTVFGQNTPSSATKTLDLKFEVASDGEVSTDIALPGFTSVQSIRVDSLTYADDSVWISPSDKACRVAPDPLMLVSSR